MALNAGDGHEGGPGHGCCGQGQQESQHVHEDDASSPVLLQLRLCRCSQVLVMRFPVPGGHFAAGMDHRSSGCDWDQGCWMLNDDVRTCTSCSTEDPVSR